MVTLFLTLIGCSEEVYQTKEHSHSENKNKISLSQFKNETQINDFNNIFKVPASVNGMLNRTAQLSEFVIDTVAIQKYVSENSKTTYSFRVYTMVSNVQLDEKYNLVYTKENDVWEKSIIAFKERVGATSTENQLENFEKLYDSRLANTTMSSNTKVCISEHYYIQCDGSCHGQCDGFACPTGQCIQHTITVDFCGGSGGGLQNPGGGDPTNPGGSGYIPLNPFEFTPNLFDNPVFDDPNYINAVKGQYFFDHLDYAGQVWANENSESYNKIIQYLIQNNWSNSIQNTINQLIALSNENNSTFTIDNTITAENGLVFNNTNELQDYINNFNNSVATNIETEDNGNNIKTSRFKFDLGMFAYLNVSVKQKLQATGQAYSIENVSSSISGLTLAMEWEQNDDDDVNISGNIATVTFTGTLSLNCFVEGIGVFFSDNVTIICTFNITTGALISSQLIGLE